MAGKTPLICKCLIVVGFHCFRVRVCLFRLNRLRRPLLALRLLRHFLTLMRRRRRRRRVRPGYLRRASLRFRRLALHHGHVRLHLRYQNGMTGTSSGGLQVAPAVDPVRGGTSGALQIRLGLPEDLLPLGGGGRRWWRWPTSPPPVTTLIMSQNRQVKRKIATTTKALMGPPDCLQPVFFSLLDIMQRGAPLSAHAL